MKRIVIISVITMRFGPVRRFKLRGTGWPAGGVGGGGRSRLSGGTECREPSTGQEARVAREKRPDMAEVRW